MSGTRRSALSPSKKLKNFTLISNRGFRAGVRLFTSICQLLTKKIPLYELLKADYNTNLVPESMAQRKKVTRTDRNNSSLRHDLSTLELPDLHPSLCPKSHHLIITTTKAVLAWTSAGTAKLFRSASGGIVAAKRAPDGSGILAVADSQVVVLHDIKKGMRRRSYKLRGSEVCMPGCDIRSKSHSHRVRVRCDF